MITIAILTGGLSTRMGKEKGLIKLGGKSLIQHVLSRVQGLGDEILIVTNQLQEYAFLQLPMVSDTFPGSGTLVGLHTALEHAHGERVLVLGCDMPFLDRPLLEHLLHISPQAEVTVPRRGDFYEPLHAVYSPACLSAVQQILETGNRRLTSLYPYVQVNVVDEQLLNLYDPSGRSFYNVNTPQDLAQAEAMLTED